MLARRLVEIGAGRLCGRLTNALTSTGSPRRIRDGGQPVGAEKLGFGWLALGAALGTAVRAVAQIASPSRPHLLFAQTRASRRRAGA